MQPLPVGSTFPDQPALGIEQRLETLIKSSVFRGKDAPFMSIFSIPTPLLARESIRQPKMRIPNFAPAFRALVRDRPACADRKAYRMHVAIARMEHIAHGDVVFLAILPMLRASATRGAALRRLAHSKSG